MAHGVQPRTPSDHADRTLPARVWAIAHMGGVDLVADLKAQDGDGNGWSALADAADPLAVRPGAILVAGNRHAHADVRVRSISPGGQVHFEILWVRERA